MRKDAFPDKNKYEHVLKIDRNCYDYICGRLHSSIRLYTKEEFEVGESILLFYEMITAKKTYILKLLRIIQSVIPLGADYTFQDNIELGLSIPKEVEFLPEELYPNEYINSGACIRIVRDEPNSSD